ncbi:WhiB family transcriptional regulator [Corynebacterium diphtheriae]|uniref:WhiB family transcriptional regulator n=1 Tax=Corynebacterium diphtheriae TaxID=1717 RepID=UPI0013C6ADB5|nr:Transcriptional regulator WhiB [Corynebacterium diphtheriae]
MNATQDTPRHWHDKAACAQLPGCADYEPLRDLDERGAAIVRACALCVWCPVRAECAREAVEEPLLTMGVVRAGIPDLQGRRRDNVARILASSGDTAATPASVLIDALKERKGYEETINQLWGVHALYTARRCGVGA